MVNGSRWPHRLTDVVGLPRGRETFTPRMPRLFQVMTCGPCGSQREAPTLTISQTNTTGTNREESSREGWRGESDREAKGRKKPFYLFEPRLAEGTDWYTSACWPLVVS